MPTHWVVGIVCGPWILTLPTAFIAAGISIGLLRFAYRHDALVCEQRARGAREGGGGQAVLRGGAGCWPAACARGPRTGTADETSGFKSNFDGATCFNSTSDLSSLT